MSSLPRVIPGIPDRDNPIVVIKYGGNAMTDAALQAEFAATVVSLSLSGLEPIVVHGGGPQINAMLDKLGIESEFVGGHRKTTPEVLEVVRMVLTGQVQRDLVNAINRHRSCAVGISGEDARLLIARQRTATVDGAAADIGLVGDVASVRPEILDTLLHDQLIPVVSSIGVDGNGNAYNINADAAAGAIAAALGADKVIFLTDVDGLYSDWPTSTDIIATIGADELEEILPGLSSGMIPKMKACLDAVKGGVGSAHIVNGSESMDALVEVCTGNPIGTTVTPAGGPTT